MAVGMVRAGVAVAAALAAFAIGLVLAPGVLGRIVAVEHVAFVAWTLYLSFTVTLAVFAFPGIFELSRVIWRQKLQNTEYRKMVIGYFLTFDALLLVALYNTVYPAAQFAAVFFVLFAAAAFADAFRAFVYRRSSNAGLAVAVVAAPVSWAVLFPFVGVEQAVLTGTKVVYTAFMFYVFYIVLVLSRQRVSLTSDYRTRLIQGIALSIVPAVLLTLSETVWSAWFVELSVVRAVFLTGAVSLYYVSCREFYDTLEPLRVKEYE